MTECERIFFFHPALFVLGQCCKTPGACITTICINLLEFVRKLAEHTTNNTVQFLNGVVIAWFSLNHISHVFVQLCCNFLGTASCKPARLTTHLCTCKICLGCPTRSQEHILASCAASKHEGDLHG